MTSERRKMATKMLLGAQEQQARAGQRIASAQRWLAHLDLVDAGVEMRWDEGERKYVFIPEEFA